MGHIRKKYVFLSVIVFVLLLVGTIFFASNQKEVKKQTYIYEVLKTKAYNELPDKVKVFIMDAYEETGEVILTEENKKANEPYLNPDFAEYLLMSDDQKKLLDVIPEPYLIDYEVVEPNKDGASLPASFDLRNYNGKSYITPLKNQSTLGVCWAFTTTEIAESYIMLRDPSFNKQFSVRQLDYLLSNNGISNGFNEYGYRKLGDGFNFLLASSALVNGVGLIDNTLWPFDIGTGQKLYHEVISNKRSLYEVNTTIDVPTLNIQELDLSVPANVTKKNNYLNLIKEHIMSDGGAYVSTQASGFSCSARYNDIPIIRVDNTCTRNQTHAMQVIGWDDGYTYKYCKNGTTHSTYTSSCSSANTVTGTGAWILRNSWGNADSYVYLAYDSSYDLFSFITDMTSMSSRNWDYVYHTQLTNDENIYLTTSNLQYYPRFIGANEKVEKVKFYSYNSNSHFKVYVCTNANKNCASFEIGSDYPGYITANLSSADLQLNGETFAVLVESTDGSKTIVNSTAVFTSALNNDVLITTPEASVNSNAVTITSFVRNIDDGEKINFTLKDATTGADVSSKINVANNYVTQGTVYSYFSISSDLPHKLYTLVASYGGKQFESDFLYYTDGTTLSVTYNANGGSQNNIVDKVNFNTTYTTRNNSFTRTGYTFSNWNTKSDGKGTSYNQNTSLGKISQSLTLYAIWTPNAYTVKFNPNGGTGNTTTKNATYDANVTMENGSYTKTGYIFSSWNTKADGTGTKYLPGSSYKNLTATNNGTVNLYAIYEPIKYTIKFNYNINNYVEDKVVSYDQNYVIPENAVYSNKPFLGWNTKSDGKGTTYKTGASLKNLTTSNNGVINLYAMWDNKSLINSTAYIYDSINQLIEEIPASTNVSTYKTQMNVLTGYTLSTFRNDTLLATNDIIGTGSVSKIYKDGVVVSLVVNVVRGDVNGDGKITSADYVSIRKHIMDTQKITGISQTKGADANKDSKITSADYIKIKKYIMNGGTF